MGTGESSGLTNQTSEAEPGETGESGLSPLSYFPVRGSLVSAQPSSYELR